MPVQRAGEGQAHAPFVLLFRGLPVPCDRGRILAQFVDASLPGQRRLCIRQRQLQRKPGEAAPLPSTPSAQVVHGGGALRMDVGHGLAVAEFGGLVVDPQLSVVRTGGVFAVLGEALEQDGCGSVVVEQAGRLQVLRAADAFQVGRVGIPGTRGAVAEAAFQSCPGLRVERGDVGGRGLRNVPQQLVLAPGAGVLFVDLAEGLAQRAQAQCGFAEVLAAGKHHLVAVGVEFHLPRQRARQAEAQQKQPVQQQARGLDAELGDEDHDPDHGVAAFLGPALQAFIPGIGLVRTRVQPCIDVIDQEAAAHAEALGEMAELVGQHAEELLAGQPCHQRQADGQYLAAAEESGPATFEVHTGIDLVGHFQRHRRADADGASECLDGFGQARLVGRVECQGTVPAAASRQDGASQQQQRDAATHAGYAIDEEQWPDTVHPSADEQVSVAEIPVQGIPQPGHQSQIEQRHEHAANRHHAQMHAVERARPTPGESLGEAWSQAFQRVGGLGGSSRGGRLRLLAGGQPRPGQHLVPALRVLRIQPGLDHALRWRQQRPHLGGAESHLLLERLGNAFSGMAGQGVSGEFHPILRHGSPLRDFFRCPG